MFCPPVVCGAVRPSPWYACDRTAWFHADAARITSNTRNSPRPDNRVQWQSLAGGAALLHTTWHVCQSYSFARAMAEGTVRTPLHHTLAAAIRITAGRHNTSH